jgi:hypothetical protein
MNASDPEPTRQLLVIQQEVLEREEKPEPVGEQGAVLPAMQVETVMIASTISGMQVLEEPTVKVTGAEEELQELIPQEPDDSDDEPEDDVIDDDEEDDIPQLICSTRIASGVWKPDRCAMVTKLKKKKEMDQRKEAIEKAEVDKVEMLLVSLQALHPIWKEDRRDADVHNSHLFTIKKFLADGMHDKVKSCMVMNRNEQDPVMYPD